MGVVACKGCWDARGGGTQGVLEGKGGWDARGVGTQGVLGRKGCWDARGVGTRGVVVCRGSWVARFVGGRGGVFSKCGFSSCDCPAGSVRFRHYRVFWDRSTWPSTFTQSSAQLI